MTPAENVFTPSFLERVHRGGITRSSLPMWTVRQLADDRWGVFDPSAAEPAFAFMDRALALLVAAVGPAARHGLTAKLQEETSALREQAESGTADGEAAPSLLALVEEVAFAMVILRSPEALADLLAAGALAGAPLAEAGRLAAALLEEGPRAGEGTPEPGASSRAPNSPGSAPALRSFAGSLETWEPPELEVKLLQVLADLAGATVVRQRQKEMLTASLVTFPNGRSLLALERAYRPGGVQVIVDPTPEEVEVFAGDSSWKLWSIERWQPAGNV